MIRKLLGALGGEGFSTRDLPLLLLLRHFFVQKVIGVNRRVKWPVHWTSTVKNPENLKRGTRYPGLGLGCYIDACNGIEIDENVWIGPGVTIISTKHETLGEHEELHSDPVRINKNCWIGANAIILAGVELGEHTVVAAGSVVMRSFMEGDQVIAGNPARHIKKLPAYKTAH